MKEKVSNTLCLKNIIFDSSVVVIFCCCNIFKKKTFIKINERSNCVDFQGEVI